MNTPTRRTIRAERADTDTIACTVGCQSGTLSVAEAQALIHTLDEAIKVTAPRSATFGKWLVRELPPGVGDSDEADKDEWRIRIECANGKSICIMRHLLHARTSARLRDQLWSRATILAAALNQTGSEW